MTDTPQHQPAATEVPRVAALVQQLAELDDLPDIARVIAARRLAVRLPRYLSAIADEATYIATRTDTQPAVARQLGVTTSQVERAVTRHRGRVGLAELRAGKAAR